MVFLTNFLSQEEFELIKKQLKKEKSRLRKNNKLKVDLNKKVKIRFCHDNLFEELLIVNTLDADPLNNKISIQSPLGKALFKHGIGDFIEVNSPEGKYTVEIMDIKK